MSDSRKTRTYRYTILYITLYISSRPATLFLATPRKKFGACRGDSARWKPEAPARDAFQKAMGPKETRMHGNRLRMKRHLPGLPGIPRSGNRPAVYGGSMGRTTIAIAPPPRP